jgi:hypothetical protein
MRDKLCSTDLKPYRNAGKFHLANMTDTLFMCHPEYNEKKYAFVHFDGPHMTRDVIDRGSMVRESSGGEL